MNKKEAIQTIFKDIIPRDQMSNLWGMVYDVNLSAIFGKPTLDIIELDRLMLSKFKEYRDNENTMSMKDFIETKFGTEVAEAIL